MRIDTVEYTSNQLRDQQRIASSAETNFAHLESGKDLSSLAELQLKSAFYKQKETGFLPKLDARLAVALGALNDNNAVTQPQKPLLFDAAQAYAKTADIAE